ncbi:MAG: hypothetical protein Q8P00_06880, partial [Dehalococcoidia bacterium]|nr:hypothetical protein [Dehalococcoidia bacterium]
FLWSSATAIHWFKHRTTDGGRSVANHNFSINWENSEWKLRVSGWEKTEWDDESDGLSLVLHGWVGVSTIQTIRVESISLNLGGHEYNCIWDSGEFHISEERDISCDIPLGIPRGKKVAYLKAVVDGQPYQSKSFTLDLPKGKQVFRMEDSRT